MRFLASCALLFLGTCVVLLPADSVALLVPEKSQQYYQVTSHVQTTDLGLPNNEVTSYNYKAFLKVHSVWSKGDEQLLEITFGEPSVSVPQKGNSQSVQSDVTTIPDRPFYISFRKNKPEKVIAHTSKDQSLLNFERGIASLFMVDFSAEPGVPISEVDVSGQCQTVYQMKSSTKVEKTKKQCSLWDLKVNYRSEKPLGVGQDSQESVAYDLSAEGQLLKAESSESHTIYLEAKPDVGTTVKSRFVLQHLTTGDALLEQLEFESLDLAINSLLEWYRVFDIQSDVDSQLSLIKDSNLKSAIAKYKDDLNDEHIGKQKMALVFIELLPLARLAKKPELLDILEDYKKTLDYQLIDLLGAVQTFDAYEAVQEFYDHDNKYNIDLLERYYQALSIGTHPDRQIIEHIFSRFKKPKSATDSATESATDSEDSKTIAKIKNLKLLDTVIQTMATLVRQSGFDVNDQLFIDIKEYLLSRYDQCKENNVACKSVYIRALQNLQDTSTIPKLIARALNEESKVAVLAMEALQTFPSQHFNENHRKDFEAMFYQKQRKYDTSVRTIALEILFAMKPSKEQLDYLLDYLASNDRQFEIKTYVIQKLKMLAAKCPRFKALLAECLKHKPQINNYHIIAQKGLTTVLARQLSEAPSFNESLLSIQEINKGILKRGSVELVLSAGREQTNTFKLGIFTSGLSSFMSDDTVEAVDNFVEEEEEDEGPATAGMELSVQGVRLRPLVFFTGQSELMAHVWSGTASELTPAYQANILAQDHEHYVILASGATLYYRVLGAKSVDLNGKVSLSIWNRNAETEINQNCGTAIKGHLSVGMTSARLESDFVLLNEPKISLQADIDFYSKIKLCMQLQRPEMDLIHESKRSALLTAKASYRKNVSTKVTHKSAGKTLALNQKNNEMCNSIFN